MGTWQFEESFNKISLEEAKTLVKYAKERGIRNFDTALVYGNEKIEKMLSEVIESSDFIITKIPAIKKPEVNNLNSIERFYTLKTIDEKINKSLYNLKRTPDVLLLHNWTSFWDKTQYAESIFNHLQILKKKGLFKMFGVSLPNYYNESISDWLLDKIDIIEAPYNQNNIWIEESIRKINERNIKLAIRSIFETGNYFKVNKENYEIKNTVLKAHLLSDFLIIGMTKRDNIDKNIEFIKEFEYE